MVECPVPLCEKVRKTGELRAFSSDITTKLSVSMATLDRTKSANFA
jgi:hypothetical protein